MSVGCSQNHTSVAAWTGGCSNTAVWFFRITDYCISSNLMAKDDFKNLGFKETPPKQAEGAATGVKGELQW